MALTPTLAMVATVGTNQTMNSAAFTPTAGALLVVHAGARAGVGTMTVPTIGGTGGLTWTQLTDPSDGLYDLGSGVRMRALAWATVVGGSPITNQFISVTITNSSRMAIMALQIIGHGGLPSNARAATHASGDPAITLPSPPAASSAVVTFLTGASSASGVSSPAQFTQLDDGTDAAGISWNCSYDAASAPTTITYATGYSQSVGTAVEVSEATAGGASRVPRRPTTRFSHMIIR